MKYSREDAIRMALEYAHDKKSNSKLIRADDEEFDWDDDNNWTDGDPETIYSIASMYADISDSEYWDDIIGALIRDFPDFP